MESEELVNGVTLPVLGNATVALDYFDEYLNCNPNRSIPLFGRALAHEYLDEADMAMVDYTISW